MSLKLTVFFIIEKKTQRLKDELVREEKRAIKEVAYYCINIVRAIQFVVLPSAAFHKFQFH